MCHVIARHAAPIATGALAYTAGYTLPAAVITGMVLEAIYQNTDTGTLPTWNHYAVPIALTAGAILLGLNSPLTLIATVAISIIYQDMTSPRLFQGTWDEWVNQPYLAPDEAHNRMAVRNSMFEFSDDYISFTLTNVRSLPKALETYKIIRIILTPHSSLSLLNSLPNVERLILLGDTESPVSCRELPELPRLKSLATKYVQFNPILLGQKQLNSVEELCVDEHACHSLPDNLGTLPNLRALSIDHISSSAMPKWLEQCKTLHSLSLDLTDEAQEVPAWITRFSSLQKLEISSKGAVEAAPFFETMLPQFQHLRHLELCKLPFTELPEILKTLPLEALLITCQSPLASLPSWIGEITTLQGLAITNAKLTALPDSITQLTNLQVLDLSGNNLGALPALPENCEIHLGDAETSSEEEDVPQIQESPHRVVRRSRRERNRLTRPARRA